MGESWIVSNLNAALSTWNDKLAEIWSLLTESPQTFKGGQVWGAMTGIHGTLQAIGYGLLVLFFAVGGYADRRAVDYGFIFYHDSHGLRQNVQPVDVRCDCADTAVHICR